MINPYYIYIVTFLSSLLIYQLGWSTLYPELKGSLIAFLVISMIIAFVFGLYFQAKRFISYRPVGWDPKIPATVFFIVVLWVIEFLYNKGVPLFMIMRGETYDYIAFGVPTLHVFIVTFTSFFSTYLFHVYLSTRSIKVLIYYFITMSFAILVFNRGMLMINVISSGLVYLQFVKRFSIQRTALVGVVLVLILYVFGVLGHLRTSHNRGTEYSGDGIMEIAKASESFANGPIPSEFIWTYLYISSPIGNLQHNIDHEFREQPSLRNTILFVNNEFVFDFISKRINEALNAKRVICIRFLDSMTVASVYTNSYIYAGWVGMSMMAIFILLVPVFYLGLLRKSNNFYVTASSILGSMYLFLVFDNMFTFTGLSFQLLYPLLLGRFFKGAQPEVDPGEINASS